MKDGACLGGGGAAPATNCERGTSGRVGIDGLGVDDDFLSVAMHRQ